MFHSTPTAFNIETQIDHPLKGDVFVLKTEIFTYPLNINNLARNRFSLSVPRIKSR